MSAANPLTIRAQLVLRGLGFDPGPIDGIEGDKTTEAKRLYQVATGVPFGLRSHLDNPRVRSLKLGAWVRPGTWSNAQPKLDLARKLGLTLALVANDSSKGQAFTLYPGVEKALETFRSAGVATDLLAWLVPGAKYAKDLLSGISPLRSLFGALHLDTEEPWFSRRFTDTQRSESWTALATGIVSYALRMRATLIAARVGDDASDPFWSPTLDAPIVQAYSSKPLTAEGASAPGAVQKYAYQAVARSRKGRVFALGMPSYGATDYDSSRVQLERSALYCGESWVWAYGTMTAKNLGDFWIELAQVRQAKGVL